MHWLVQTTDSHISCSMSLLDGWTLWAAASRHPAGFLARSCSLRRLRMSDIICSDCPHACMHPSRESERSIKRNLAFRSPTQPKKHGEVRHQIGSRPRPLSRLLLFFETLLDGLFGYWLYVRC